MMKTYVTFQLNDQYYGIEILYVREINQQLDITPVQHAPDCILGLANLRGQIVTIADLACLLSQESGTPPITRTYLIVRTDAELAPIRSIQQRGDLLSVPDSMGFLIDRVDEIVSLNGSELEAPPSNLEAAEACYLSGVVKLSNRILGILDVPRLLRYEPPPLHPSPSARFD